MDGKEYYDEDNEENYENNFTIDFWKIDPKFKKVIKTFSFDLHGLLQFMDF